MSKSHVRKFDRPSVSRSMPKTAPRFVGRSATYIQAWIVTGPWEGIVYSQDIALGKLGEGCDIVSTTMVRHNDGRREQLPGTVAAAVFSFREGQQ